MNSSTLELTFRLPLNKEEKDIVSQPFDKLIPLFGRSYIITKVEHSRSVFEGNFVHVNLQRIVKV